MMEKSQRDKSLCEKMGPGALEEYFEYLLNLGLISQRMEYAMLVIRDEELDENITIEEANIARRIKGVCALSQHVAGCDFLDTRLKCSWHCSLVNSTECSAKGLLGWLKEVADCSRSLNAKNVVTVRSRVLCSQAVPHVSEKKRETDPFR